MNPEPSTIRITVLRPGAGASPPLEGLGSDPAHPVQTPPIDIYETEHGLILEADLPSVKREDVIVQLDHNVLTIFAKFSPIGAENARLMHEEFPQINYLRSFILTDDVDREGISADLNSGVLRLSMPKAARSKPRRIEIRSS